MKHQNMRDRLDEGEGMVRHAMDGNRGHKSGAGLYRNEVEEPMVPKQGNKLPGMGCQEMKGEAMDIAYGQAGMEGCRSDEKKIKEQFKNYHWDGSAGASGY